MMMKFFKLRRSRGGGGGAAAAVHHHQSDSEEEEAGHNKKGIINGSELGEELEGPSTLLTVWRKSLLYCCTGFTVFGSEGNLVYRVDNYERHCHEVVLMDFAGKSLLTVLKHRKEKLSLLDDWLVYRGEGVDRSEGRLSSNEKKQPICYVKKHASILRSNSNVLAHIFFDTMDKRPAYVIEGSYLKRSCKIFDRSNNIVAEIKRKEATNGCASFGSEVFHLIVRPRFDPALAMTMVLLLDQMFT